MPSVLFLGSCAWFIFTLMGLIIANMEVPNWGKVFTKMLQVREIKFISLYTVDMTDVWH